jgi:hypothetical protein
LEASDRHAAPESAPLTDADVLATVIRDLAVKQQALSELIDRCLADDQLSPGDLGRLMSLHSQNAARLGRLLRDKQSLGNDSDAIAAVVHQTLDELGAEWGLEL